MPGGRHKGHDDVVTKGSMAGLGGGRWEGRKEGKREDRREGRREGRRGYKGKQEGDPGGRSSLASRYNELAP